MSAFSGCKGRMTHTMALFTVAGLLGTVLPLLRAISTDACGKDIQLSNLTERITSPGYNSSLSCGWKIHASSPDHLVGLSYVAQFESSNCQHGSLSFYDGSDNSSGLLLQLCGTDRGGILSSRNTMYVQFTSSAPSNGTRFVLTASNTERCRGTFIATPKITNFTIPGKPYVSYRNLNCKWIITSENENHTVQVKSKNLFYHIRPSLQSCTYDVVRVYNGNTTEADQFLGEYCSTQMPNFYSSKNSLLLVLTTDGNTTSFGLQMQYSSIPESDCSRTHVIYDNPIYILSPGYPNSYGSNRTCDINLYGIMSPNMRLDVLFADMEGTYPQCDTESVRLMAVTPDRNGHALTQGVLKVTVTPQAQYYRLNHKAILLSNVKVKETLTFSSVNYEFYPDHVPIGDTISYYLAGKICGNSSISPIGPYYSNGLFMKLVFKSSSDIERMAFRFRVSPTSRKVIPHQSDNCGPQFRNATARPKILSSPGYPGISAYEDNCIWKLTASNPKMMVRIVVIDSDSPTFEYTPCDYRVTFYNGPSIFNDTILTWCGDSKPALQSTGSAMTIQFETRFYSPSLKGFRLKYLTTNETYRCGGTVNISTTVARTLTGPYQNSQDCRWTIHAPDSMIIQVNMINLYPHVKPTAPPKTCNADYVEFYSGSFDNSSTSIGKWCGQYSDGFISPGHTITARFHSGIENKYRGIQLILKAGHFGASRMTSLSANYTVKYITSPNFPFNYPSNVERTWIIDAGEYYRVKINVTYSQLENSTGCQNDYVEAFDGSDSNAASLGRWCGGTKPNKTSSGSLMFLKFKSNSHVVDRGFIIKYTVEFSLSNASTNSTPAIVGACVAVGAAIFGVLGAICGAVNKRKSEVSTTVP